MPLTTKPKDTVRCSIHVLDLTKQSDVAVLLDLTCHANIASAHLAPPCGTASKARERPLPQSYIKSDPLRSEQPAVGIGRAIRLDATTICINNCGFPHFVCS